MRRYLSNQSPNLKNKTKKPQEVFLKLGTGGAQL
jgi:hypothetical protein